MDLFLLRHGIAEDPKAGQSDALRALTAEGRTRLKQVLETAHRAKVEPTLILSSPLVTTAQWEHDADSLLRALPDSTQAAIARHEADHTTSSPEYVSATKAYYALYLSRTPSHPTADNDSSRAGFGRQVYEYMWGPSEFSSTGTLKTFDATPWLRGVRVPTLFIAGEFDEATPASTRNFSRLVPGSQFVMIPGSGHLTTKDNPDALRAEIRAFLARVEHRQP